MTFMFYSLSHALEIFQENKSSDKDPKKLEVAGEPLKVYLNILFQVDHYDLNIILYFVCHTHHIFNI
jgi:hypothetical protein